MFHGTLPRWNTLLPCWHLWIYYGLFTAVAREVFKTLRCASTVAPTMAQYWPRADYGSARLTMLVSSCYHNFDKATTCPIMPASLTLYYHNFFALLSFLFLSLIPPHLTEHIRRFELVHVRRRVLWPIGILCPLYPQDLPPRTAYLLLLLFGYLCSVMSWFNFRFVFFLWLR